GLKDDILILSAVKKFFVQVLVAAIIIHMGGLRIDSMHGLFGYYALTEGFSLALSYISIIVVINAFNLIDGVDGLAGSLGLLSMTVFGTFFFINDMLPYALFAFAMAGSLIAFLRFNYNPAKIFMGDSGSLLLGLVNAILVMKFISVGDNNSLTYPLQSVVAIGLSILIVPLADTLRVFSIRIFNGRSPFAPDRNHIHHLLLDRGFSPKYVTICCLGLNAFFVALAYAVRGAGPTFSMLVITSAALALLAVLVYAKKPVSGDVFVVPPFQKRAKLSVASTSKVVAMADDVRQN
ncbi:MAG TPA: MraY family glycosyltransferase, partial [Flavisolibacter sp.]|nr:MraY family glycosyltransferase [Flavisolibacter sp.]